MNIPEWIDGCSDNRCIVDGPKVGTNGGCNCIDRHMDTMQINKMRAFVRELKKQNAELETRIVALAQANGWIECETAEAKDTP